MERGPSVMATTCGKWIFYYDVWCLCSQILSKGMRITIMYCFAKCLTDKRALSFIFSQEQKQLQNRCSWKFRNIYWKKTCVEGWRPATLLKRESCTGVFLWILRISKNSFFIEHICGLLLQNHCCRFLIL